MSPRLGLALLAVLFCVVSCGPSSSKTATIRLKAGVGDTYRLEYSLKSSHAQGHGPESAGTEELSVIQVKSFKCTKVEGEKTTWQVKTEEIAATGTGSMQGQAAQLKLNEDGKVETLVRDAQNRLPDGILVSVLEPIYPNQPVSEGDQWRGEISLQGFKVLVTYTLERLEKVDGVDAAVVSGSVDGASVVKIAKPMTMWVDVATGWPLKGEGTFSLEPQPDYRISIAMKIARK